MIFFGRVTFLMTTTTMTMMVVMVMMTMTVSSSAIFNFGKEDQNIGSLELLDADLGADDARNSGRGYRYVDGQERESPRRTWRSLKHGGDDKMFSAERHLNYSNVKRSQNDFEEIMKHVKHMSPNFMRRPSFIGRK